MLGLGGSAWLLGTDRAGGPNGFALVVTGLFAAAAFTAHMAFMLWRAPRSSQDPEAGGAPPSAPEACD